MVDTSISETKDSAAFFNALDAPIQFNSTLIAALAEHDQRVSVK